MRSGTAIQARLLLLVTSAVLLVWLLAAAMTWFDARHELDELLDSHLAQAAALLVTQQRTGHDEDEHGLDAPSLHRYAPKVAFQVFHEGQLTLRTANAPSSPMVDMAEHWREGFKTVDIAGVRWRVFATYGAERDVQVYVGEQIASRADILWAILHGMLTPILLALPMLALAVWLAVRQALQPLRQIRAALLSRKAQALDPVRLPGVPSDLAPMLDALNDLLARIAALMDAERRFTADAAHELRTPIAAIRTQAQVALSASQNAERRHALEATLSGCDRATRLVEQLLTLSRLEAGTTLNLAPLDLAGLTRQVMADQAPALLARQQHIEFDAPQPCTIRGDAALLMILVRNLIDNASRYSPDGARVRVTLRRGDSRVTLTVEDSGPGMDAASQERLGERFFRVLGSGQSGSGLGWSIVRRVAQAHQADIAIDRSADLGGLTIRVSWTALD